MNTKYAKKVVFLCLVGALLLGACQGAATTAPTKPTSPPKPTKETEIEQKPTDTVEATSAPQEKAAATHPPHTDFVLWIRNEAYNSLGKAGLTRDFQVDFRKEYPDYLWLQHPTDDPILLFKNTKAFPETPCIVQIANDRMAELLATVELVDLTDYMAPYLDKLDPRILESAKINGKYYGMPWYFDPILFFYRRDILKDAGFSDKPEDVDATVATWDSYLEMCKTIRDKTGHFCNYYDPDWLSWWYEIRLSQQGLGYYHQDGRITVDSPENIAMLEEIGKFWESDVITDTGDWDSIESTFSTSVDYGSASYWVNDMFPVTKGLWGMAHLPGATEGGVRQNLDPGYSLVIPEACNDKELAWKYIEYISGREDSAIRFLIAADFVPAYKVDKTDPRIAEPEEAFGGQATHLIYANLSSSGVLENRISGPDYDVMRKYVYRAIQKYFKGEMSAAEALKEAADQIREETGRP